MIDETNNYLRNKIMEYRKEEIVNALFDCLDFITIDRLSHHCCLKRLQQAAIDEEEKYEKERATLQSSINEYNALVAELKKLGIEKMPTRKIKRMSELLKQIRRVIKP